MRILSTSSERRDLTVKDHPHSGDGLRRHVSNCQDTGGASPSPEHTWPLFVLLLIVFAGAILGDNAAESLLLAHCDTRIIPNMFAANALLLFIASTVLMSIIDRMNRGKLFLVIALSHGVVILGMRAAFALHASILYPILFSYAYVSKIMVFLLFWTIANDLTDSRRASAVFPLVAAGGTLGAIGASFAVPLLLSVIPPENLLVVWSIAMAALCGLFAVFRGSFGNALKAAPGGRKRSGGSGIDIRGDFRILRQEPLLRNIAVLYFLLFFILINQHFAFYSQLKSHLVNAQGLASFLGFFNGCSMFATFMLQVGVSGRILKRIGATRSMLFLPMTLFLVFAWLTYLGFF